MSVTGLSRCFCTSLYLLPDTTYLALTHMHRLCLWFEDYVFHFYRTFESSWYLDHVFFIRYPLTWLYLISCAKGELKKKVLSDVIYVYLITAKKRIVIQSTLISYSFPATQKCCKDSSNQKPYNAALCECEFFVYYFSFFSMYI